MAGFTYGLAREADDAELRALLARTPMPGEISLAFLREPSFFAARRAGNEQAETMVCRDADSGELLGFGERSLRRAFVDGLEAPVGYLGMLRGTIERRGGLGLARGYRYFHELERARPLAPFYITTILEENEYAISVLAGGRGGLPLYEPLGRFVTYLLPLRGRRARVHEVTEAADENELAEAVEALNDWNRRHQFAPAYRTDDLAGRTSLLPAFSWRDLTLVRERGRVLGTLGVWNQQSFKQTLVSGYARWMQAARPVYNGLARLRGLPPLPAVGDKVATVYGSFLSAADDDQAVAGALVERALERWSGQGHDYLAIGLAEGHPLAPALEKPACRTLLSRIYAAYWPDAGVPGFDRSRLVQLETATL
jgi:hypothetical protein